MNPPFKAFLSHKWANRNHEFVMVVKEALKNVGVLIWLDTVNINTRIEAEMLKGIEESSLFIAFLTQDYIDAVYDDKNPNDFCKLEFNYGTCRKKDILPVVMERGLKDQSTWLGSVGAHLGQHLYVDFSDVKFSELIRDNKKLPELPEMPELQVEWLCERINRHCLNKTPVAIIPAIEVDNKVVSTAQRLLRQLTLFDFSVLGGEAAIVAQLRKVTVMTHSKENEANCKALREGKNICENLMKVLVRCLDQRFPGVLEQICGIIGDLCDGQNRVKFRKLGACEAIMRAMKGYEKYRNVISQICRIIDQITFDQFSSIKIASLGGGERLMDALKRYKDDPDSLCHICPAIGGLYIDNEDKFKDLGCCSALHDILTKHSNNSGIVEVVCKAIRFMSDRYCAEFGMRGFNEIVRALEKNLNSSKAVMACCNTIINLSCDESKCINMDSFQCCEVLRTAFTRYKPQPGQLDANGTFNIVCKLIGVMIESSKNMTVFISKDLFPVQELRLLLTTTIP